MILMIIDDNVLYKCREAIVIIIINTNEARSCGLWVVLIWVFFWSCCDQGWLKL